MTAINGGEGRHRQALTAGFDGMDRFRRWDLRVWTGFDGGTGRYGQALTTGRDGRSRFRRRTGR